MLYLFTNVEAATIMISVQKMKFLPIIVILSVANGAINLWFYWSINK